MKVILLMFCAVFALSYRELIKSVENQKVFVVPPGYFHVEVDNSKQLQHLADSLPSGTRIVLENCVIHLQGKRPANQMGWNYDSIHEAALIEEALHTEIHDSAAFNQRELTMQIVLQKYFVPQEKTLKAASFRINKKRYGFHNSKEIAKLDTIPIYEHPIERVELAPWGLDVRITHEHLPDRTSP